LAVTPKQSVRAVSGRPTRTIRDTRLYKARPTVGSGWRTQIEPLVSTCVCPRSPLGEDAAAWCESAVQRLGYRTVSLSLKNFAGAKGHHVQDEIGTTSLLERDPRNEAKCVGQHWGRCLSKPGRHVFESLTAHLAKRHCGLARCGSRATNFDHWSRPWNFNGLAALDREWVTELGAGDRAWSSNPSTKTEWAPEKRGAARRARRLAQTMVAEADIDRLSQFADELDTKQSRLSG
jgi:hypothetical protein